MFNGSRYLLISDFNKAFEIYSTYLNVSESRKQTMFQVEAVIINMVINTAVRSRSRIK